MALGFSEILLLVVIVILIFGPKKIPELARAVGLAKHEYDKAKNDIEKESKELLETSEKKSTTEDKTPENKA